MRDMRTDEELKKEKDEIEYGDWSKWDMIYMSDVLQIELLMDIRTLLNEIYEVMVTKD